MKTSLVITAAIAYSLLAALFPQEFTILFATVGTAAAMQTSSSKSFKELIARFATLGMVFLALYSALHIVPFVIIATMITTLFIRDDNPNNENEPTSPGRKAVLRGPAQR